MPECVVGGEVCRYHRSVDVSERIINRDVDRNSTNSWKEKYDKGARLARALKELRVSFILTGTGVTFSLLIAYAFLSRAMLLAFSHLFS